VSELIDGSDVELASERLDVAIRFKLLPCEVVVSHVHEAGLGHLEVDRESLSLHEKSKVVTAIVRVVNLSDLNGVISQEVVDNEGEIIEATVEAEDTSIVIKELLLCLHTATTERPLHILLQRGVFVVTDNGPGDLALNKAIDWDSLRFSLRESLRL
jgi:hypothetical protein